MPSSRIPSPARSYGPKSTPRRYKPRTSRSVGSPARSSSSVKLTSVMQLESFNLSPMPTRRSVLTDTTDIDIPRRKSWWKKLDENSREIMEVLHVKEPAEANNAVEEYIEVDVLSQEKKNYTLDLPESSDGESINSIVIPQRKLFTLKENQSQKKFAHIIDNRETLATLHKSQREDDKTLNVGRKNLLNQGTKQRTKPLFPLELLNISANKSLANKTKELATTSAKGQVKSLFGNKPGTKRKNMFTDFIVSDSEDEIPELQPKVFGFQRKTEQKQRKSLKSRANHEPHVTSPTSSITDIEMDDWRLLPSSTMVDHQLEDGLRATPIKRPRLGKVSETNETIDPEGNSSTNKTKRSNKSLHSKNKSINKSKLKHTEDNEINPPTAVNLQSDTLLSNNCNKMHKSVERIDSTSRNLTHEQNVEKNTFNNKQKCQSKNGSPIKLTNNATGEYTESSEKNKYNKSSNTVSKIDQALQSDDEEDFTLVYDNNDNNEVENEVMKDIIDNESQNPKRSLKAIKDCISVNVSMTKQLQIKLKTQNAIDQASQHNNVHSTTEKENQSHDEAPKNLQVSVRNTSAKQSSFSSNVENAVRNSSKYSMVEHGEIEKEKQVELNAKQTLNHNSLSKKTINEYLDSVNKIISQNIENDKNNQETSEYELDDRQHRMSVNEKDDIAEEDIDQEQQPSNAEETEEEDIHESDIHDSSQEAENYIDNDIQENDNIDEKDEELNNRECDENKVSSLDIEVNQNKKYQEREKNNDDNQQDQDKILNKNGCIDVEQNEYVHNDNDGENHNITQNKVTNDNQNLSDQGHKTNNKTTYEKANVTHDKTGRPSQKNDSKIPSPEVILHNKPSQMESFTVQGRNTSVRKTKSIIKNLTIRPSLVPVRESTGLSDGSRNSSAEGSGWDSHRTTRATLRQTFGKDFTPRKSLRALVMEKSAKRRTNLTEINAEFSRFPQANSTELPESEPCAMNESDIQKIDDLLQEKSLGTNKTESSDNQKNESYVENKIHKSNHDISQDMSDADDAQEIHNSDSHEIENSDHQESNGINESSEALKNNESDQESEVNECDDACEMNESDQETEIDESSNAQHINECDQEESQQIDESAGAHENNESYMEQDMIEPDDAHDNNESDQEESHDSDESSDIQTNNESNDEVACDTDEEQDLNGSDNNIQEMNENSNEISHNIDESDEEMVECNELQEKSASNISQEINESDDECEYTQEDAQTDHEMSCDQEDTGAQEIEYKQEEMRKSQQTSLEIYLQKVKQQNTERKKQLEEQIRNSLKAPTRDVLNPFKVPAVPKLRRIKAQPTKAKAKPIKTSVISLDMLPVEVLEDMKYKPPKRYRPTNASWITKRLYKFLENKLEPKYDYKARVRSEKLVETIYNFTKDIRRHSTAPTDVVDALKHEMARLNIVQTHFEFYEFFHEYMPREVRVKVVPDVFNKISLPKRGVFSDILR